MDDQELEQAADGLLMELDNYDLAEAHVVLSQAIALSMIRNRPPNATLQDAIKFGTEDLTKAITNVWNRKVSH